MRRGSSMRRGRAPCPRAESHRMVRSKGFSGRLDGMKGCRARAPWRWCPDAHTVGRAKQWITENARRVPPEAPFALLPDGAFPKLQLASNS